MDNLNDEAVSRQLVLKVLKEVNRVIKGHQLDRKQLLTVGDVISFVEIAIQNVATADKLKKQ